MNLRRLVDDPVVGIMSCAQGIHAGGPGSGCHGDNCGRHGTGGGTNGQHPKSYSLKRMGTTELHKFKKTAHKTLIPEIDKEIWRRSRKMLATTKVKKAGFKKKAAPRKASRY